MIMELGDIVRRLREDKDLTQENLAKMVGMPTNTIHRYENDYKDRIPLDRLERIAKALQTNMAALYSYKENPQLLRDPINYVQELHTQKVSILVELDGTVETLNTWFNTLKKLNAAL